MFAKLTNSWELVKASWEVLRSDKELLIFPIVSFVAVLLVSISFFVPIGLIGYNDGNVNALGYVLLFLYYVVMYTVIFFFNTALVGAALKRLEGGDPTLSDGLSIATSRLGQIIGYAVIASTVGVALNWLRDQGFIGRIAAGLIGFAWGVATFLVVPVLVVENV